MNAAEPVIRSLELTRRFGELTAVDRLSFDVERGELFGLVGPDGAGKTTILRMLAGVLPPSSGDVLIDGTSIVGDPEAVKHDIAYMPQRFGLYTDLTVQQNLDFYADLYGVPKRERPARLERLYQFSNLAPFRDRLAGNLSGGMKQKLGLSCALIHQPDVLLLDEPTFGVDPISRRDLWLIVHEMVGQGVTVVVSTAYMDEAERFDRVALLHDGRILAVDSPTAFQRQLQGDILEVQVDRPRVGRDLAMHLPAVQRAAIFGHRLHLTVASAERDAPAVESALRTGGLQLEAIRKIEPSMEDVFIDFIERLSPAAAAA